MRAQDHIQAHANTHAYCLIAVDTLFDKKLNIRLFENKPLTAVINGHRVEDYLRRIYRAKAGGRTKS